MMTDRLLRALLLAGLLAAPALLASPAAAQQQLPPQPNLSPDEEISPRQVQTVPATPPKPRPPRTQRSVAPTDTPPADNPADSASAPNPAPAAAAKPPAAHTIACSGVFAKDSSHVKLAQSVGATNIEYGQVSGSGGSALNASILYAKDPKRRLEVLWQNEAARSDTSLIVITGQSQWHGPKGLKLGLALAALEKLNGKPFKLSGFDQPDGSAVIDWQGGALAALPGGCQVGVKLAPDKKAAPDALKAAAGKEFQSSDAAIRAVKPVVGEIILGYSQ
jgi:hypothetical protein